VAQDIGRVLLNLFNNAFYAVQEKSKTAAPGYEPMVTVSVGIPEGDPGLRPKGHQTANNPESGMRNTQSANELMSKSVIIRVADNGPGIPESIKEKIFQPFFTTKPTGQGTGLGLSLSYDIVKAHGGTLEVSSAEGEGTLFTVRFPV
jgi:signal transduction histidine kinase